MPTLTLCVGTPFRSLVQDGASYGSKKRSKLDAIVFSSLLNVVALKSVELSGAIDER